MLVNAFVFGTEVFFSMSKSNDKNLDYTQFQEAKISKTIYGFFTANKLVSVKKI